MPIARWLILAVRIGALGVAGTFAALSWKMFRDAIISDVKKVDSTWGGFGGTMGGCSISRPMAWLVATFVTLVLFAALALEIGEPFAKTEPAKGA